MTKPPYWLSPHCHCNALVNGLGRCHPLLQLPHCREMLGESPQLTLDPLLQQLTAPAGSPARCRLQRHWHREGRELCPLTQVETSIPTSLPHLGVSLHCSAGPALTRSQLRRRHQACGWPYHLRFIRHHSCPNTPRCSRYHRIRSPCCFRCRTVTCGWLHCIAHLEPTENAQAGTS